VKNSYAIIPNDQISTASLYRQVVINYGAKYRGVPHNVFLKLSFGLQTDQPKSDILMLFPLN
jgi:hypothetical protein